MPKVLPNTPTTDAYPSGSGGAQLGIGDKFSSGFFVVANNAAYGRYLHGQQGQGDPSPDIFLPPGTYPLTGTAKDPLAGMQFKSAIPGVPAQVFGVFFYPDEAQLLSSAEFTATVSPSGGVTNISQRIVTGIILANGVISAGTGFTVIRTAAGRYAITFVPAFVSAPAFVAAVQANSADEVVTINVPTPSTGQINVNLAGVGTDRITSFVAIEMV